LFKSAVAGILIWAPALETGGVTETVPGELIVADRDHEDGPDRDEIYVFVAAPAACGPGAADVLSEASRKWVSGFGRRV